MRRAAVRLRAMPSGTLCRLARRSRPPEEIFPDMLENFSFRTIVEYLPLFGQGFAATLWLSVVSFAGALAVGIVPVRDEPAALAASAARRRKSISTRSARRRLLAQLYFLYFGLPRLGHRPAGAGRRHPRFVAEQRRLHRRDHPRRHPVDPARAGGGRRCFRA